MSIDITKKHISRVEFPVLHIYSIPTYNSFWQNKSYVGILSDWVYFPKKCLILRAFAQKVR